MDKQDFEIWQIVDSRAAGGIESHISELSKGLASEGYKVKVVFLVDYGKHPLKERLDQQGISYFCLDGSLSSLWKAFNSYSPTVVHTHGYKAGIWGRICGQCLKIPVISTYHAGEKTTGKLALYNFLDRLSAPLSSPIAVSPQIAKQLPVKAQYIRNFVNIPDEMPSLYRKNIGFVGRLSEEKGPDLFCELAKRHTGLNFHLYGDGPLFADLREKYQDVVTFHGQSDMNKHWYNIDLLCMPSRFEGLPMAALEAMSRAIPVLASQAGALSSLIDHGENGWVLPLDHFEKFDTALIAWANMDQKSRRLMGRQAREKVIKLYSPQVIIPQIEKIYHQAAGA